MKKITRNVTLCALAFAVVGTAVGAAHRRDGHRLTAIVRNPHTNTPEEDRLERERSEAFQKGAASYRQGDLRGAEAQLQRATRLAGDDPVSQGLLGGVYEAQGNRRRALDAYRTALAKVPGRRTTLTSDPRVLVSYGDLCEEDGDRNEAVRAYAAAASGADLNGPKKPGIDPNSEERRRTLRRRAYQAAAEASMSHGDDKGAEKRLRSALRAEPKSWEAKFALSSVLYEAGERAEAKTMMLEAERDAGPHAPVVRKERARLGYVEEPTYVGFVNGKFVDVPKPPSDAEALTKVVAERKRKDSLAPRLSAGQLDRALLGIRTAIRASKDPARTRELEKLERSMRALRRCTVTG